MCNLYSSSKDLLSSEITQHTAIIVKKAGNKTEYTLSDNSYTLFNHAKPHVLFIVFMFCLLDRTIYICVSCFRVVKIWFFEYNSLILTTGCSRWHLMAKNSLRIWELELWLSTKMAKAIRSPVTAWNRDTVQCPGSYRGFPRRVSLGTGLAKVDQRSWVLVLCITCRSWLQKSDAWVLPALL